MIEVIKSGDLIHVSRPLGNGFWHVYRFRRQSDTEPYSVNEQLVTDASWCDNPNDVTVVAPRSQLEYAYIADGEDVGGSTHRNERVDSLTIKDNCVVTSLEEDVCITTPAFQMTQNLTSFIAAGDLSNSRLTHKITASAMRVLQRHSWLRTASLGWYYAAMMPVWNNGVYDTLEHGGQSYLFSDYLGQNNALEIVPYALTSAATGMLHGLPIRAYVRVTDDSVDSYNNATPFWQINRGAQDDWSKWYARRSNAPNPLVVNAGDVWRADSFYRLTLG